MPPDYNYTEIENANNIIYEKLLAPSKLETIDTAFYTYIDEEYNQSTETQEGFKKTPVIWVSAERSHQIKNNPDLRDKNGNLKYPIITITRKSVEKDMTFKGSFQAQIFSGQGPRRINVPIARRINQKKTSEFANADARRKFGPDGTVGLGDPNRKGTNKKVVYQTYYAPLPIYVKVIYDVKIVTDYQTQMNDLITPFLTRTGQINTFFINADGHRYETFIKGNFTYDNNTDNLAEEVREFSTSINFDVLGYLMGDGANDEQPKFSVVENFVEVKIPRERVLVGDINELTKKSFYRE
jgi:hypothetical protein